jgi:transposase-like protein
MRLQLILHQVKPTEFKKPLVCPHRDCQGRHYELHQEVDKPLKDAGYGTVSAHRYRCLRCKRTFRVYLKGVTRAQNSERVKSLSVMLYWLGLSYGATSLALEALGVYMSKTSVYEAVEAAAEKVPGLKQGTEELKAALSLLPSRKCGGNRVLDPRHPPLNHTLEALGIEPGACRALPLSSDRPRVSHGLQEFARGELRGEPADATQNLPIWHGNGGEHRGASRLPVTPPSFPGLWGSSPPPLGPVRCRHRRWSPSGAAPGARSSTVMRPITPAPPSATMWNIPLLCLVCPSTCGQLFHLLVDLDAPLG